MKQPHKDDERLLTRHDIGRILGVCARTVDVLCEQGALRRRRVGGQIRFKRSDLDEYLERSVEAPDGRAA